MEDVYSCIIRFCNRELKKPFSLHTIMCFSLRLLSSSLVMRSLSKKKQTKSFIEIVASSMPKKIALEISPPRREEAVTEKKRKPDTEPVEKLKEDTNTKPKPKPKKVKKKKVMKRRKETISETETSPLVMKETISEKKEYPIVGQKKSGAEIDEIFSSMKRKKPEAELSEKRKNDTSAKPMKLKKRKSEHHERDGFVDPPSRSRKKTEDGLTIYTEEELGIGKDSGGTPLCPFDCDCCC